jgi:hypothetical protein
MDGYVGFEWSIPTAGTLVATLTPEYSYDNGTTWFTGWTTYGSATNNYVQSVTVTSGNPVGGSFFIINGVRDYRLRVSSYTSGSAIVTYRLSVVPGTNVLTAQVNTSSPTYAAATYGQLQLDTSGNLRVTLAGTSTVAATQSGTWSNFVKGTDAVGAAPTVNPIVVGGLSYVDGKVKAIETDAGGAVMMAGDFTSLSTAAAWTSATTVNTALTMTNMSEYANVNFQLNFSGTLTGGQIVFEASEDGTNWSLMDFQPVAGTASANTIYLSGQTGTNIYQMFTGGIANIRARLSVAVTGTGNVVVAGRGTLFGSEGIVTVQTAGGLQVYGSGTAGSPAGGLLTVQGQTGMTPLKVDGSGVTQPVSGTVAASQSGTWSIASITNSSGSAGSPGSTALTVQGISGATPVVVSSPVAQATGGGTSTYTYIATASTNSTNVKASAGQVYSISGFNATTYNVYFKLYNKASAPTVGTDSIFWQMGIPAGGGFTISFPTPLTFGSGIGFGITKANTAADTTATLASDCTVNIQYA